MGHTRRTILTAALGVCTGAASLALPRAPAWLPTATVEERSVSPALDRQLDHLRDLAALIAGRHEVVLPPRSGAAEEWVTGIEARLGRELALLERAAFAGRRPAAGLAADGEAGALTMVREWSGPASEEFVLEPGEYEVRAVQVENTGTTDLVAPSLVVNARDWSTIAALASDAAGGATTPAEKAENLWSFVVENRTHGQPAHEGLECHDPVKLLNVYGYGLCDDAANVTAALARELGFETRVWALEGHVMPELHYDGDWHLFDPDQEAFYRREDGAVASLADIVRAPQLLGAPVRIAGREPFPLDRARLERTLTSVENNRHGVYPVVRAFHDMRYTLRPGESVTLHAAHWGCRFAAGRYRLPRDFANGVWQHRWPASESSKGAAVNYALPWPIVGGQLRVEQVPGEAAPSWSLTVVDASGGERHAGSARWDGEALVFDLDLLVRLGSGDPDYALTLRLDGPEAQWADARVSVELVFQHAPRALPRFHAGANRLEWSATSGTGRVTHVIARR